MPGFMKVHNWR